MRSGQPGRGRHGGNVDLLGIAGVREVAGAQHTIQLAYNLVTKTDAVSPAPCC